MARGRRRANALSEGEILDWLRGYGKPVCIPDFLDWYVIPTHFHDLSSSARLAKRKWMWNLVRHRMNRMVDQGLLSKYHIDSQHIGYQLTQRTTNEGH